MGYMRCPSVDGDDDVGTLDHGVSLAADLEPVDHLADRADRLDQAPEGAEQAQEDQQPDQVAGDLARLVQAGVDAVQQRARLLVLYRPPAHALSACAMDRCSRTHIAAFNGPHASGRHTRHTVSRHHTHPIRHGSRMLP